MFKKVQDAPGILDGDPKPRRVPASGIGKMPRLEASGE